MKIFWSTTSLIAESDRAAEANASKFEDDDKAEWVCEGDDSVSVLSSNRLDFEPFKDFLILDDLLVLGSYYVERVFC